MARHSLVEILLAALVTGVALLTTSNNQKSTKEIAQPSTQQVNFQEPNEIQDPNETPLQCYFRSEHDLIMWGCVLDYETSIGRARDRILKRYADLNELERAQVKPLADDSMSCLIGWYKRIGREDLADYYKAEAKKLGLEAK